MAYEINSAEPAARVAIDALVLTGSPRSAGEDPDHIDGLSAVREALPPILVHRPTMRVIDGRHRVRAAQRRGEESIAAMFFDGSAADAFVLAVRLNVTHGLPLSLSDRKRAAQQIMASYPYWSDRRIASPAGLSAGTVAELRRQAARGAPAIGSRVGRDGRVRPLDVAAGRRLAGRLITENPRLSLRQVARVAEISPETETETTAIVRTPARREPALDLDAILDRLRADPALCHSDTGRNLVRLLVLHTRWTEEWEAIATHLPPHCGPAVADLAGHFADLWASRAAQAPPGRAEITAGCPSH